MTEKTETFSKITTALHLSKQAAGVMVALENGSVALKKVRPDLEVDFIAEKITEQVKVAMTVITDIPAVKIIELISGRLYDKACKGFPLPWEKCKHQYQGDPNNCPRCNQP